MQYVQWGFGIFSIMEVYCMFYSVVTMCCQSFGVLPATVPACLSPEPCPSVCFLPCILVNKSLIKSTLSLLLMMCFSDQNLMMCISDQNLKHKDF